MVPPSAFAASLRMCLFWGFFKWLRRSGLQLPSTRQRCPHRAALSDRQRCETIRVGFTQLATQKVLSWTPWELTLAELATARSQLASYRSYCAVVRVVK